ncbi:MAG: hypothetical protein ACI8W8_001710 [Rhodothermales bacterium]
MINSGSDSFFWGSTAQDFVVEWNRHSGQPKVSEGAEDLFDGLAENANATQSREAMDRLWSTTYSLGNWYFAARGALPNVSPFVGVVAGKPYLFAFTDTKRAEASAWTCVLSCHQQGFAADGGSVQVLSIPIDGLVENIEQYASVGVHGILFNNGPHGYFAPLANVKPMQKYFVAGRP